MKELAEQYKQLILKQIDLIFEISTVTTLEELAEFKNRFDAVTNRLGQLDSQIQLEFAQKRFEKQTSFTIR